MDRNLELLIQIQTLDSEISKLEEIKKSIPEQIERVEKEFALFQKELNLAKEEQIRLQKELKSKEIDVEAEKGKMLKTQRTLLQVKTNKEYAAALAEIEAIKSKISSIEDALLELMEKIEDQKARIAEKTKIVAQKDKERKERLREKGDESKRIGEELASRLEKRGKLLAMLDGDALKLYIKIGDSRKGLAVVPVRDNACQGCFILLTPQMVQEIRTNDNLIFCSHCSRILFWPFEEKPGVTAS